MKLLLVLVLGIGVLRMWVLFSGDLVRFLVLLMKV